MTPVQRQPGRTRERVLDAACRLFAERGYRGTTVALICRMAKVNIAAVNYYFGGKENLYQQAWRHAHDQVQRQFPHDGGVGADQSAEERLRGRIRSLLHRALAGDTIEFGIVRNEMANPTGLLRQVIDDAIRPIRRTTQAILHELLGPRASEIDVELCEHYLIAPLMQAIHRRHAEKHQDVGPVFREDMLDAMAEHFAVFALAGIRETRRRIEGPERPVGRKKQRGRP